MRTKTAAQAHRRNDDHFPELAEAVRQRLAATEGPFFVAEAPVPLYTLWLEGFEDPAERQAHACHCCRRFLEQYGALVTIDGQGRTSSVMWDPTRVPEVYVPSVARMQDAVERAAVAGVHLDGQRFWGNARTPDRKRGITWEHFSAASPAIFRDPLRTAAQVAANVREERGMLARGLADFPREAVLRAKAMCDAEGLYRGDKVLGVVAWLLGLHDTIGASKDRRVRDNLLWRAAATAPAGFCHVRSTMVGTLLEDLVDPAKSAEDAQRAFAAKMHPLQYRRTTAAPTDGQIAEAEKVVERLRSARALDRRFARLDDLELLWRPQRVEHKQAGGVFDHLRGRLSGPLDAGAAGVPMTWEKFARQVLPAAERVEVLVPAHGAFIALVTAAHPDAPPMLQWDSDERRNPVSWYVYHGGAHASRFNLQPGWRDLTGITLLPPMWGGRAHAHEGRGAVLVVDGCRDVGHERSGGFFVESLKSEYHAIRRTLESHMMQAPIAGKEDATACGLDLRAGGTWRVPVPVRVTAGGVKTTYTLDRWD